MGNNLKQKLDSVKKFKSRYTKDNAWASDLPLQSMAQPKVIEEREKDLLKTFKDKLLLYKVNGDVDKKTDIRGSSKNVMMEEKQQGIEKCNAAAAVPRVDEFTKYEKSMTYPSKDSKSLYEDKEYGQINGFTVAANTHQQASEKDNIEFESNKSIDTKIPSLNGSKCNGSLDTDKKERLSNGHD